MEGRQGGEKPEEQAVPSSMTFDALSAVAWFYAFLLPVRPF